MTVYYGKLIYGREYSLLGNIGWVLTDVPPFVVLKLKALFECIPKHRASSFFIPDTLTNCKDIDWFITRYPMEISYDDKCRLENGCIDFDERKDSIAKVISRDYVAPECKLNEGKKLRAYQQQFVSLVDIRKKVLLGDDVGLGKTVSAIGVAVNGKLPMLVVCPKNLIDQWRSKIEEFSDLNIHEILDGKVKEPPIADIYITKYTMLTKWADMFSRINFKAVVFDEIQDLRRQESSKYRAAKEIIKNIEYHIGLSATPIYNYGDEIFNVIDVIDENFLGTKDEFIREWCGYMGRVKDPNALGSYLMDSGIFLRRTKGDVGMELDPVNTIIHTVELTVNELDKIDDLAVSLAKRTLSGSFIESGMAAREFDRLLRQATGIGKAKSVSSYVRILLENKVPTILVGWHRACYDIWLDDLKEFNPVMYTGTESVKEKNESVEKFIKGETNLFILSLRSGIGIDGLQQRCSTVVFGELDWSPQIYTQVIGRVYRDGQKDIVDAIYLIANGGSDTVMVDVNGIKRSQSEGIINPFGLVQERVSDDSRVKELARTYLKSKGIEIEVEQNEEKIKCGGEN